MFRVEWIQSAVDELATFWMDADSSMRSMITDATAEVERRLAEDPVHAGESRDSDRRIDFIYPLAVTWEVDLEVQLATILHVRVYRRR